MLAPYNFLSLSATQEKNLLTQVQTHRDEALQARDDFPLRQADRYRRYLADPTLRPPGPWPESARLFVPTTRDVLERLHTEVWDAIFANVLQIQAKPFSQEDIDATNLISKFMRWAVWCAQENWIDVSEDLLFDALLDSVGVAKVFVWEPPWPAPSEDARRFLKRLVKTEAMDLGMMLIAPDAEGLQFPECRYVAQEFFLRSDDILRLDKRGFDVPEWDELGDSQQMTERKRIELEREGERVVEFRPESIPFVESYERFVMDDDLGEEDVIVSWFPDALTQGTKDAGGWIAGVRRLTDVFPQDDRPRRPFFPVTFWRQPRQWRGLNIPDRLESMQDLINKLHEQLVNYGEVSMLPFVFVNTYLTGEIPDLRTVRPGSTVPIDDIAGVNFAPTRSLNRHFAEQIQLAQSNVERDSQVTDFSQGRQGQATNAPRTASATMALLGESRKSYGKLVRRAAFAFSTMLTFNFRLWQACIPEDTYAAIGDVPDRIERETTLWDRVFNARPTSGGLRPPMFPTQTALPVNRETISGFYDCKIEVNPEEAMDRQIAMALFQVTAPVVQAYPLGLRLLLKRLWEGLGQQGFDDIYPEQVAALQTQQNLLTMQVQIATFEAQLAQIQQAQAQQQLAVLQQGMQQFQQTGVMPPGLEQAIAQMAQGQNGQMVGGGV